MEVLDRVLGVAVALLFVCVICYFICVYRERKYACQNRVVIKSRTLTYNYLKRLDRKCFKLGKIRLSIGDEIKLRVEESDRTYKGKVLGIKNSKGELCLLTEEDNIMEFRVIHIKKLKIISRYGKII